MKLFFRVCVVLPLAVSGYMGSASAQVTLDPGEIIGKYAEIIHISLSPEMPADTFLSILPIGLAVDDDSKYFPLANSCLKPETFPGDLGSPIRVSDVYERALDNMARIKAPAQPTKAEVEEARTLIRQMNSSYQEYAKTFVELRERRDRSNNQAERSALDSQLLSIEQQWKALGYKHEYESALATILNSPDGFVGFHKTALEAAKGGGAGPGTSPSVVLSVSRENWGQLGGWVTVKFDDSYESNTETTTIKQRRGSGGFNGGFFRIGGGGSSIAIEESIVADVRKLSIEVDLKLVTIERPWFNHSVFFEPHTWGWRSIERVTGAPPLISTGLTNSPSGPFAEPMAEQLYAGSRIDCQLVPSSFLLAKRRKLLATVSKDTYDRILRESGGGGSGSFFGFSLGGGGSDKFERLNEVDNSVEFSITSLDWTDTPPQSVNVDDVVILGTISRVVPRGPDPQGNLPYGEGIWVE